MRFESILVLALAGVLACEEVAGDEGDAGGGGESPASDGGSAGSGATGGESEGPAAAAVERCRDACDDQLLFDCIDADVHELCWNACPVRGENDIDLFVACTINSAGDCNPGCLENFLDADPVDTGPDTTAGGGPDTTEGGSVGSWCEDACEAFLGRGCTIEVGGFESCESFCAALEPSLHEFVAMCVENADGCELPPECTFPDPQ